MQIDRRRIIGSLAAAAASGVATPFAAFAQGRYPQRPIALVIPVPPGGQVDAIGRIVAQKLGEVLGQQVVVDNRAGASTIIGTRHVLSLPADGYTMLLNLTQLIQNPLFYPPSRVGYDPADFVPISRVGRTPAFFVVAPEIKATNLKEFVALAKASPTPLTYGTNGQGSTVHMYGSLFAEQAGIKLDMIPYRGEAPIIPDLVTGRVKAAFVSGGTAVQLASDGKARAIAITGSDRMKVMPNLQTFKENGYANIDAEGWYGFFMRKGTPQDIVDRVSSEIDRIIRSPELTERLLSFGIEPGGGSSAEFAQIVKKSQDDWVRILKATSLRPE